MRATKEPRRQDVPESPPETPPGPAHCSDDGPQQPFPPALILRFVSATRVRPVLSSCISVPLSCASTVKLPKQVLVLTPNLATQVRSLDIVTVPSLQSLSPVHSSNTDPLFGDVVSVTTVPTL